MDPRTVPLKYLRDTRRGYSTVYPEGWHEFDLTEAEGKLYSLSPTDLSTCLSIELRDLGTPVSAADLPALRKGFLAGLRQAAGSKLFDRKEYDVGFLVGLEAKQTFREGSAIRKRWIRLLFKDSLQVRLMAQGGSLELFDYWLPAFNPAMTGFRFDGGLPPTA